jgi:DNA-binding response OmpR family regulator
MPDRGQILFIIEQGGYAIHADTLTRARFEVITATSMRKALSLLKKASPDLVFAEFNYGPRYGVLISNLEPLLSYLGTRDADVKVAVFTEPEHRQHLEILARQYKIDGSLVYPFDDRDLLVMAQNLLGMSN